jgi:acetyl-CoA C-acetyltransferase
MPHPVLDPQPNGQGAIETYTVVHDRKGPRFGLAIGRMKADGRRFIAHTKPEPQIFAELLEKDCMGRDGTVTHGEKTNTFDLS